jgi:hypothetical protein
VEGTVKAHRVSSGRSAKERGDDRGRCGAGERRGLADELDGGGRHGRGARGGWRWESI